MRNAIDFSYARPTPETVAALGLDILVYTGPARPDKAYLDAMRAAGVAVTLVQESDPNRSQQGFAAGVADAQYADSRADEVDHQGSIAYVVSDGSAGDPSSGADQIAQYAAGVQSVSRRPFFFYGNQYATDAALRGAPQALGSWVPSTWGTGSLLTQEANVASPVADTDLNTVHADYTGSAPVPAPTSSEDCMYDHFETDPNNRADIWWFSGAGRRLVKPDEWKIIQTDAALKGVPVPKPYAGTAETFASAKPI